MAGREDSWVDGLYEGKDEEKKEEEESKKKASLPKRRRRTETPKERELEQRKYVRMENPNHGSSDQEREQAAHMGIMSGRLGRGLAEIDEEETDQIIEEPEEVQRAVQQQAPVFTRANRGPNLNKRQSRRRVTDEDRDFEFEWEIPEFLETPPPPIPPSLGSTPIPETPPPRTIFEPTNYESKVEASEYDKKLEEINKNEWSEKPLTKWVEGVVVKKSQRAMYKENTEQVQEGLKVVETLTEPPLSKPLSLITTLLPYILFAISMIVSIIGIIGDEIKQESHNRGPDYSCFTLDIIDLTLLTCNALLHRSPWFKKKTEEAKERFQKRQQLIDNILAETLLYPSILCSLIGVTTDRIWTFNFQEASAIGHDERLSIIDVILISFDVISLLYVYGSRIYMVYTFMKNLDSMFPDATDQNKGFSITTRIFYAVVLNTLLFAFMIIHLALQVYHENLTENKPPAHREKELRLGENVEIIYMSYAAAIMMFCTVFLPIFNIVIFVLANYYYIIELMIKINLHVVKKEDCRKRLEEHGDVAKGIMGFAGKNVHATPGRLRDIQSLTTFQRIFFVLREWWIDLIFAVWATMVVGYCVLFFDYYNNHVSISDYANTTTAQQTFSIIYICSFMVCSSLFALGNYHSVIVVTITIIIMIPLFLSFAIQAIIDKCSAATGKAPKKEKDKFAGIVTLIARKDRQTPAPSPILVKSNLDTLQPPPGQEGRLSVRLKSAFSKSRPPTAYPDDRPQPVYSNGKPQTAVYSVEGPLTSHSNGRPPTAQFNDRPATVYPGGKRPAAKSSHSPPPTAKSQIDKVNYVPPHGSRSPLLSATIRHNQGQSPSNSFVLSMASVEVPESNNYS